MTAVVDTETGEAVTTSLPLGAIRVGDRDRSDLGDIRELADSIAAVGLLHPVVVTKDNVLVSGDRRLAAARALGWAEVPVTVVDLTSAADVLRAEGDENTCRKPLTPYEASRARERRAAVLAAAQPKGGRGKRAETAANLAEVSPSDRQTRKTAATGTGYSASTLAKVDTIRVIAERGVVRRGKQEVPAPAEVVEVAKAALEGVKKTGAAVDRASRDVAAAVDRFIEQDASVVDARYRAAVTKSIAAVSSGLLLHDPARAAAVMDDPHTDEDVSALRDQLNRWFDAFAAARRTNLRLIGGGR